MLYVFVQSNICLLDFKNKEEGKCTDPDKDLSPWTFVFFQMDVILTNRAKAVYE